MSKILIADDEKVCRIILKNILESFGNNVVEVSDGKQLIEYFSINYENFDYIITDKNMNDNIEINEIIRKVKKIKNIPVILLTCDDDDIDKSLFDYKISKPFNIKDFKEIFKK